MQIIAESSALRDLRLAWQAAQYARFAYHKPGDMPPEPTLAPKSAEAPVNTPVALAEMRGWMQAMHARSHPNGD
ncbi:hypothetical protein DSD19_06295 [Rhodovulum sp. BSW8]|uniref:hypothetical protein n=1 Tax=Rhodovulum sp. BSW8 TaxID=2259645 RepID=UPI000DE35FED|nr:hypothetical protein [Rhodovulum sp. BSW8]RBO54067.1 hypothetical protein DSD19_06295 [Rhodovulum sp. BSW8]